MQKKTKILYVDDEKINLTIMEINFRHNYEVVTAENGIVAMEKISQNPDTIIVISDMKMPNMNGLEFIATAKGKYPLLNYFILTGFDITPEIQKALDDKLIINYFKKPFNMNEIENEINKVINN